MCIPSGAQTETPKTFSGASALNFTAKAVAFGMRPSGSAANAKQRAWIRSELASFGCEVSTDAFTADTPDGPIAMENIIAKLPGKSGRAIAITGHYDTKKLDGFLGANDGGSSTGTLLELARVLAGRPRTDDLYIVFFDGEEAVRDWTATDSVYGSRHLAKKWAADGTNRRLKALINVDMTGDKNLDIVDEYSSSASLRDLVWNTADALGYGASFLRQPASVEDDHLPFLEAGVRALDLIDFDYGPGNAYWHTPQDTMDKLGAQSFQVIGNVLMRVIPELEAEK
ncbi:MAG TPA: M28 family peptidase [Bryobacteraceae bacterium]|nr:M28 family peptidase [Bryobacteraceae bacterium]